MGWTWPSWLAIVLGAVSLGSGLVAIGTEYAESGVGPFVLVSTFIGGAILLASGLHSLQNAWSSCCDWSGCDCDHCEGCSGDDCCGRCGCYGGGRERGHEGPGHEGHGHDGGHSH